MKSSTNGLIQQNKCKYISQVLKSDGLPPQQPSVIQKTA